jgi:hypothetical protein
MPARKKSRVFPINIYSTALTKDGSEVGWVKAGEPVNLEHLNDNDYRAINDAYPEGMDPAEAQAKIQAAAAEAAERHGAKG